MAKRSRAVRPDLGLELDDGRVIGVVSEEALQAAVADAVTVAMWSGGMFSVALNRHPTGVPHEMVTVGALVVWQDRDDAKPQPEPASPAREIEPVDPEVREEHYLAGQPVHAAAAEAVAQTEPEEWSDTVDLSDPVLNGDGSTGWDPTPEELEEQLEREADAELPATEDLPVAEPEVVVVGAPVGAVPGVVSAEQAIAQAVEHGPGYRGPEPPPTRAPRESGAGSRALPFGDHEQDLSGAPRREDIVRGDASSRPRGDAVPAPAGSSEGISDGLDESSLPDEDDSSIPEDRR